MTPKKRKPFQVRDYDHPDLAELNDLIAKGQFIPDRLRRVKTCIHCDQPPTKEALFKSMGMILIEKYCDKCLKLLF